MLLSIGLVAGALLFAVGWAFDFLFLENLSLLATLLSQKSLERSICCCGTVCPMKPESVGRTCRHIVGHPKLDRVFGVAIGLFP